MKQTRSERVTAALGGILDAFKSGKVAEAVAVSTIKGTAADIPSAQWSLSNRVLQFLAGTSDARGYKQWEKVGRHVSKGTHGFPILAPRFKTRENAETGEIEAWLSGFLTVTVHPYENTEGEAVETPDYRPPEAPRLFEVAEKWGLPVSWHPFAGDYLGVYSPMAKSIRLATHDERVFWHELAHAAHDRISGGLKGGQDKLQECAAELAACALARMYGVDCEGKSYEYIRHYGGKGGAHKACVRVLALVQKIIAEILDAAGVTEAVAA